MKKLAKHIAYSCCLAIMLSLMSVTKAEAQYSEYEIKAAMLVNFAKHCGWPDRMFDRRQNKIVLTIFGADPFGKVIDNVVRGRTLKGKYYFEIRRVSDLKDLRGSHIIFISKSERNNIRKITEYIKSFRRSSVLAIGDGIDGFCKQGGIINLFSDYTFNVNWNAASEQGILLDNRLLNIANEIVPTESNDH